MRALCTATLGVAVFVGALSGLAVSTVATSPAFAQGAAPAEAPPQPVALTPTLISGAIAAQKDIHALEAKQPQKADDKPDPKMDAQIETIVKKNGFADAKQYAGVTATIETVMTGIDPETKAYIGPTAVLKKQIAEVQADKKMPAKEKTDALSELNAALKTASPDKPSQANIDLVIKNFDALSQATNDE